MTNTFFYLVSPERERSFRGVVLTAHEDENVLLLGIERVSCLLASFRGGLWWRGASFVFRVR
jgi:hypothetical protein